MGCGASSDTPSAEPEVQEDFVIHLPLTRQYSGRIAPHRQGPLPNMTNEELRACTVEVEERSTPPVAFYVKAGLGTPPQQRVLLCDTGSANTWAAFDSADDTSWTDIRQNVGTARRQDTSSFSTQHGASYVFGNIGKTTMSIDGKSIGNVYLGAAGERQQDTGVLGLGFQGLGPCSCTLCNRGDGKICSWSDFRGRYNRTCSWSVLSTWSEPKSIFALSMKRTASGADGQITLGGWDNTLLPNGEPQHWVNTIAAAPTADSTMISSYWMISMAKLEANETGTETCYYSQTFAENASATILDTGDSLIMLPRSTLESIFPSSKGFAILSSGQVSLGENTLESCPDIKFSFGGQTHVLQPVQYVDPLNPGLAMLKESPDPSSFGPTFEGAASVNILGHAFLEHFYTIWDAVATPPRVAFCPPASVPGSP